MDRAEAQPEGIVPRRGETFCGACFAAYDSPWPFCLQFQQFLEKKKKIEDIRDRYEHIKREKISTEEKMEFIRGLFLKDMGKKISFLETIQDSEDKYDFVLSFSSIMEMIKQNKVTAEQKRIFGDILVEATDRITEEIVAEDVLEGENDDRQIN